MKVVPYWMDWMTVFYQAEKFFYKTSHNISHPTALPYSVSLSCLHVVCACLKSIGLCAWAHILSMSCVCTISIVMCACKASLQIVCVQLEYFHTISPIILLTMDTHPSLHPPV